MAAGRGRRLKNALLYVFGRGLLALLAACPLCLCRPLGRALGHLGYLLAGRERRRGLRNLEASDLDMGSTSRRRLLREVFARLGHHVLEALTLSRRQRRGALAIFDEASRALLEGEGSALVVTAHLGNFELLAAAVAQARGEPVYVLARRSYDARFTALLERRRRALGVIPLWVEDRGVALRALRALRSGAWVGVLVDRVKADAPSWLPFLGRPAPVDDAVLRIAEAARARVLLGFASSPAGGARKSPVVALEELPTSERAELLRAVHRRVEGEIRARPEEWLWTLDRWREGHAPGGPG